MIYSLNPYLSVNHLLLWFSCSVVSDSFSSLWTVAHQAPLSMGFSRQEYWNGLPFPSPGSYLFLRLKFFSPTLRQQGATWWIERAGSRNRTDWRGPFIKISVTQGNLSLRSPIYKMGIRTWRLKNAYERHWQNTLQEWVTKNHCLQFL